MRHELDQLKKLIFGSKRERFVATDNPEQLGLDFGLDEEVETVAQEQQTVTYQRRKKKHPGRTTLPDNIPTEEIIIEPAEDTSELELSG